MVKQNKKWNIEFSGKVLKKVNNLPDETYNELVKIVKGFKEGTLDPTKVGKSMDLKELNKKLKCSNCSSKDVEWFLDKNSNEVDFHCLECDESFWMTYKEYKRAIKNNPNKLI